jgi:hypothetical protein
MYYIFAPQIRNSKKFYFQVNSIKFFEMMFLLKYLLVSTLLILRLTAADELVEMSGSGDVSSGEEMLGSGTESVDLGSGLEDGSGSGKDESKKPHCKSSYGVN